MCGEKSMRTASKTAKAKLEMIYTKKEVSMLRPTRIGRSGRSSLPTGSKSEMEKDWEGQEQSAECHKGKCTPQKRKVQASASASVS